MEILTKIPEFRDQHWRFDWASPDKAIASGIPCLGDHGRKTTIGRPHLGYHYWETTVGIPRRDGKHDADSECGDAFTCS